MSGQNQKFKWQTALGVAISCGMFGVMEASAQATPWNIHDSDLLAQVGVRSRITPPTSLNLRPQNHIPLPTTSRSRDYYGYPRHRGAYHHDRYDNYRDRHYNYCRKNCSRNDAVIIINPSRYSEFDYSNGDRYIRIIRQ